MALRLQAQVAELVDALRSGRSGRKAVEVRVFSWAPFALQVNDLLTQTFRSAFRMIHLIPTRINIDLFEIVLWLEHQLAHTGINSAGDDARCGKTRLP